MPRFRLLLEAPAYYEVVVKAPNKEAVKKWAESNNEDEDGAANAIDYDHVHMQSVDHEAVKVASLRKLEPRSRAYGPTVLELDEKGNEKEWL